MAADLLQNLIPIISSSTAKTAADSTAKNSNDTADCAFEELFDEIKSKLDKSLNPEDDVKSEQKNAEKSDEKADTEAQVSVVKETDTTNQTENQNKSFDTSDSSKEETSSSKETPEVQFATTILNNILLEDKDNTVTMETSEGQDYSLDENIKTDNTVTVKADNEVANISVTTEADLPLETQSSKIITDTDTDNSTLKIDNSLQKNSLAETSSSDVEVLDKETLVKVDDKVYESVDELAVAENKSANETTKDTKVSQEVIDSLDMTVHSVEQKGTQADSGNYSGKHSNASEEIIRMSLENVESTSSADTGSDFSVLLNSAAPETADASQLTHTQFEKTITSAQAANTQSPKPADNADILNQINSKITLPQENASSKVNIILQPENLGKVSVEILQTKDGITAKMIAETPQVKEILDKSIESLKNTIASQGVNVNNISVKVEETSSSQDTNLGFDDEQFNREASQHKHNKQNPEEKQNTKNIEYSTLSSIIESENSEGEIQQNNSDDNHSGSVNIKV